MSSFFITSQFSSWILAIRPRTLSLSVVPVVVGSSIAWSECSKIDCFALPLILIAAISIQICSNLYNDAIDYECGCDGSDRIGPLRVTATGLLSSSQVKHGAFFCMIIAMLSGTSLVWIGGWPILLLGLISLFATLFYTSGPLPISYTPFGEVCALIFFGICAVAGTVWLHIGYLTNVSVLSGIAVGCFSSAVLLVNNYRDVASDIRVGRHTLSIIIGSRASCWIYCALMTIPFILLPLLNNLLQNKHVLIVFLCAPFSLLMIRKFFHENVGPIFNKILSQTAQIQLIYGILLCFGLLL
ncbi:MAG: 1,4-dihydroxy-2-naphthoate octaprenyltransferase [Rhodospirillaceae bacterium]|jgi:1,4-dihydroxy-2-naphthoate octaprenyltransferase|nr:1,4-dihydroxy-2-naphthoate octaprenyltransferase [Rhodospirillaceae bacterium]